MNESAHRWKAIRAATAGFTLSLAMLPGSVNASSTQRTFEAGSVVATQTGDNFSLKNRVMGAKCSVTDKVNSLVVTDQIHGTELRVAVPFAILREQDASVIGSTRFWNIERWSWPPEHPRHGRPTPDACEIGYTWFARSALRTGANTEAKFLMLRHAFETWQVLRVCLHTDVRNQRSRTAIERIGGKFEGILRAHRIAADFTPRDSARFSIVAAEWPVVKQHLEERLDR